VLRVIENQEVFANDVYSLGSDLTEEDSGSYPGFRGFGKEAAFRTKNPDKGKWPILKCIALSTKMFCITDVLAGSFTDNTAA
jgi:hypothetical protein